MLELTVAMSWDTFKKMTTGVTTGITPLARTIVVAGASYSRWQHGFLRSGAYAGGFSWSVPTTEALHAWHYTELKGFFFNPEKIKR